MVRDYMLMLSTHPTPLITLLILVLILVLPDYNDVEDNALANYGAYSDVDLERQPLLRAMIGESANHLLKSRRRRLGIADECCRQSCTFKELSSYCI